jgi:hypothetical protein
MTLAWITKPDHNESGPVGDKIDWGTFGFTRVERIGVSLDERLIVWRKWYRKQRLFQRLGE